jgi:hypothetical protein
LQYRPLPLDFVLVSRRNTLMITRRDLLVAAISVCAAIAGLAAAQSTDKPVMHSCVFNWADLKVVPTKQGEHRSVFDAPTPALAEFECHITTLNPGESPHPPHHHADEELMVIKEGTLAAMQNGVTNIVTEAALFLRPRTRNMVCATLAPTAPPISSLKSRRMIFKSDRSQLESANLAF